MPPRTITRSLAALVIVTLALAGCLTIETDLTISGDTVSGTIVTAIDKEIAQQLEVDPDEVFSGVDDGLASLPGVTAGPYDDGAAIGTEHTLDQVPLADLNRLAEDDPYGMRITRDQEAGTYEFALVMDLEFLGELEGATPDPGGPDPALMAERFNATIVVTFPGEVTEHNGELDGTTVTWRPPAGELTELHAVALDPDASPGAAPAAPGTGQTGDASPGGGDSADGGSVDSETASGEGPSPAVVILVALGVVALAAGVAAGLWLMRRRRRDTTGLSEALSEYEQPETEQPGTEQPGTEQPTAEHPAVPDQSSGDQSSGGGSEPQERS